MAHPDNGVRAANVDTDGAGGRDDSNGTRGRIARCRSATAPGLDHAVDAAERAASHLDALEVDFALIGGLLSAPGRNLDSRAMSTSP